MDTITLIATETITSHIPVAVTEELLAEAGKAGYPATKDGIGQYLSANTDHELITENTDTPETFRSVDQRDVSVLGE